MGSSRLPGKVWLPLPYPNGTPLLLRVLRALEGSARVSQVLVATTEHAANDPLEAAVRQAGHAVFRGDEEHVLRRFVRAAEAFGLEVVVRLTSDNPFLDVPMLDALIDRHLAAGVAYTRSEGLPTGLTFEIVSAEALREALAAPDLTPADCEHVTPYIIRHPERFAQQRVRLNDDPAFEALRLTVDYPSDFAMASLACALLGDGPTGTDDLKALMRSHPWVFEANRGNFQKVAHHTLEAELQTGISVLRTLDMPQAAAVLQAKLEAGK
jgi:spore coat polysaccharide biosynthesis protein SpsF